MGNKKKTSQLGMPPGTAANKLRKNILFSLLCLLNLNTCWQCKREIESADVLSIEHKVPWLHSEDPVGLYFDLNNIAFSHLKCNIASARQPNKIEWEDGKQYCSGCKKQLIQDAFSPCYHGVRGTCCRSCKAKEKANWRKKKLEIIDWIPDQIWGDGV